MNIQKIIKSIKILSRLQKLSIFLNSASVILILSPLIRVNGHYCTVFSFMMGHITTSDEASFIGISLPIWVPCIAIITMVLLLICTIRRTILGLEKINLEEATRIFCLLITTITSIVFIPLLGIEGGFQFTHVPLIIIGLLVIEYIVTFFVASYLETMRTLHQQHDELQSTDNASEHSTIDKLSGPPATSKFHISKNSMLFKVARKNTLYNWKSLILLFTSTFLASTLIITCIALQNLLQTLHTSDKWYLGYGLFETLKSTVLIIGFLTILLMALSLEYYVMNRIYDYSLFIALGIKKKALHLLVGIEYGGTLFVGFLAGTICGTLLSLVLRTILASQYIYLEGANITWWKVYSITFLICIGIFFFSAIINFEIFIQKDFSNRYTDIRGKQSFPNYKLITFSIGFILIILGLFFYNQRKLNENIYAIIAILIGLYFIFKITYAVLLNKLKRSSLYLKVIFAVNNFYYRFNKNQNYMFILFTLHLLTLFYFSLQIATLYPLDDTDELYPYDYVCFGDSSDAQFFEDLNSDYEITLEALPMVRITVPGGDPTYEGGMGGGTLQGQHIGLSCSTYEAFTGNSLSLTGNELYLIFQQDGSDSAHSLDWNGITNAPSIHSGMPYLYAWYDRYDIFDQNFTIYGEERNILLGQFYYGYQENIIVFSDEMYDTLCESASLSDLTGATMIYLIKTDALDSESVNSVAKSLEDYELTTHIEYSEFNSAIESVYDKETLLLNTSTEHLMKLVVNLFLFLFFMISTSYIILSSFLTELSDMKRQNQFYQYMGMTYKKRLRMFNIQHWITTIVPIVLAAFTSVILLACTIKLRLFTFDSNGLFIRNIIILWAIYIAIQLLGIFIMQRIMIRKILNSQEGES